MKKNGFAYIYLLTLLSICTTSNSTLQCDKFEDVNVSNMSKTNSAAEEIYDQGWKLLEKVLQKSSLGTLYTKDKQSLESFPKKDYTIHEVSNQGKYYIDGDKDGIKAEIIQNIPWEPRNSELIKQYVKPGSTVIDIGAHIGIHTITMSKCVGSGRVIAFEPHRKIFNELCMNLDLNHCKNAYPMRCALGKTTDIMKIVHVMPSNEGGAFVMSCKDGDVAQLALDDFHFTNVSFIKMDVENMESDVLDGALQTIQINRPVILLEIQGNSVRAAMFHEDQGSQKQIVINKLKELNYSLRYLNDPRAPNDYLAIPL